MIEYNANLNTKNRDEETPLHIAIGNNEGKMARILLENGADSNIRDLRRNNSIEKALTKKKIPMAKLILYNQLWFGTFWITKMIEIHK